jgi:hypothetical protein
MTYPKYEEYKYLYPPRAPGSHAIDKSQINFIAGQGFGAQKKKNGTNNVIFTNGTDVIFRPRHGDENPHKLWTPLPEHIEFFKGFGTKWSVFCSELLHSKVPGIRHQIFIHDVLVWQGEYLIGTTFNERQNLLKGITLRHKGVDEGDQFRIHPNVTIAKLYTGGALEFKSLFKSLKPEDEGLVFKRLEGKLSPCIAENSNADWQYKCRIPWTAGSF